MTCSAPFSPGTQTAYASAFCCISSGCVALSHAKKDALRNEKLAFETRWHSYADVDDLLYSLRWVATPSMTSAHDAALHSVDPAPNEPRYTLPALTFTSSTGSYTIADSERIASHLEQILPSPSAHISHPRVEDASKLITNFTQPARPLLVPLCAPRILLPAGDERGAQAFLKVREKRMQRSMEVFATKMGGEVAWSKLEAGAAELAELLKKDRGPFVLGDHGACASDHRENSAEATPSQLGRPQARCCARVGTTSRYTLVRAFFGYATYSA